MIRSWNNQIPYPTQDTKWERNTNNYNCIKYKTAQAESQNPLFYSVSSTLCYLPTCLPYPTIFTQITQHFVTWVGIEEGHDQNVLVPKHIPGAEMVCYWNVWLPLLTNYLPIFLCTVQLTYICSAQSKNRYNSRIVLCKVGILTLLRSVGILTLRNTILELFLRKVRIWTKWESHFISFIYCTKWDPEQIWNILYGIVWSLFQVIFV